MITGDNRLTAAAIAAEAGVDDFLAEATPEAKLALSPSVSGGRSFGSDDRRRHQRCSGAGAGRCRGGDDSGTQAAKEAGNMVDLDSNPTKLIEVVHIGKQMLMTRGSLTTLQHCQRCGEILRHYSGGIRGKRIRS